MQIHISSGTLIIQVLWNEYKNVKINLTQNVSVNVKKQKKLSHAFYLSRASGKIIVENLYKIVNSWSTKCQKCEMRINLPFRVKSWTVPRKRARLITLFSIDRAIQKIRAFKNRRSQFSLSFSLLVAQLTAWKCFMHGKGAE